MFNAFKKWTRGSEEKSNMPSGVRTMGQALQRKFARGVQYNSKLKRDQINCSSQASFDYKFTSSFKETRVFN